MTVEGILILAALVWGETSPANRKRDALGERVDKSGGDLAPSARPP